MTAVLAEELTKTYGDFRALDGLSLSVDSGELFGFLGPNGAGKTTTIGVLTGQLTPDGGRASVLGTDPTTDPVETRRRIGVLPEQESPPSFMTPREYLSFVGTVRGLDDDRVDERMEDWADRLSYREKLDTLNTDLSRGQQQKVMITQAFLHEPGVVFIDEPLANLDPIIQERVKRVVVDYADRGNTVFLSTHHIEVAEEVCTRVGIVNEGRLIARRDPDDLAEDGSLLSTFLENVEGERSLAEPDASERLIGGADRVTGTADGESAVADTDGRERASDGAADGTEPEPAADI
jgi:ABC-2 type transport system ATP-binding protein